MIKRIQEEKNSESWRKIKQKPHKKPQKQFNQRSVLKELCKSDFLIAPEDT